MFKSIILVTSIFYSCNLFANSKIQPTPPVVVADHIKVRLVSDQENQTATLSKVTSTITIGIHYKMDPNWHIYWKNPGDSGAAPKFKTKGAKINKILWPYPERIPVTELTNYGYNDEAVLFLELENIQQDNQLKLEWLVCKIDCIPGFATFNNFHHSLHVDEKLIDLFKDRLPRKNHEFTANFTKSNSETFDFRVNFSHLQTAKEFFVFPENGEKFLTNRPKLVFEKKSVQVKVPLSSNAKELQTDEKFTVVVQSENNQTTAHEITVSPSIGSNQFFIGLFFAFLGGLILNIMPCVFPILFLKAFSFLKAPDPKEIIRSSWLYSTGVVLSFMAIGGVLLALRASGKAIGWGFQLQNPYIVASLCILFFFMALSFLDAINFEKWIPAALTNLGSHRLASGDFATGVLAVIVASPCTAPFMGSAIGLTLLLQPLQSILIFISLGIGFAAPLPLLAHWPQLIHRLPKAGPWMVTAKKLMAIPLLATCFWLFWVFSQQIFLQANSSENWAAFDKIKIQENLKTRPVFIDYTAAWCITCQVNKRTVLDTDEVQKYFKNHNIYLVRADWTNYDQEITESLERFGRNSVPIYVFYRDAEKEAVLLPELLTKKDIFKLIEKESQ